MYPSTSLVANAANAAAAYVASLKSEGLPAPEGFFAGSTSMDSPLSLDRGSSFQEATENEFNLRHLSILDPGSPRPDEGEGSSHTLMLEDGSVIITAPGTDPSTFLSTKSMASSRKIDIRDPPAQTAAKEQRGIAINSGETRTTPTILLAHNQNGLSEQFTSLTPEAATESLNQPDLHTPLRGHVDKHTPIDNNNNSFGISNEVLHTVVEDYHHR